MGRGHEVATASLSPRVNRRPGGNPFTGRTDPKEPTVTRPSTRTLTRPREGRMLAGVCAGLAQRFGWSVGMVRLLFVLSIILPGSQVLVYLILWLLMPSRDV